MLPAVFQRTANEGNPLTTFLEVMEVMHAPAEDVIEDIDRFFNPYQSPDEMIPFLAFWVDLNRLFVTNEEIDFKSYVTPKIGHLREAIANAARLSKLRGTKKGLILFLQIITGEENFSIREKVKDENGKTRPFHMKITAPESLREKENLLTKIINSEKPVHLTYELEFIK